MTAPDGPGHLSTDELFRQHAGFVARFLSRLGVPPDQLEDALQEVFLVVHRNGGYKPGLAKPASYLGNIALRAAAQHRRRHGLARQRHADGAPLDRMPGDHEDPARAAQTRQDLERLQLALQRLPEELCTTLLLVEMEGESCVSVAAALGCPVGTIYWRLHHARKELRAALHALETPRKRQASVTEPLDERAQPARSWMILFGLGGFDRSEAARLLQLAHAQPGPASVEGLLARHHELVRSGATLPAWASGVATQPATWLSVLGAGSIAAGMTTTGVIVAASVLALQAPPPLSGVAEAAREPAPSAALPPPVAAPPAEELQKPASTSSPRAAPIAAPQTARARSPRASERTSIGAELDDDPALDVLTAERPRAAQAEPDPAPAIANVTEPKPRNQPEPRAAIPQPNPLAHDAAESSIERALSDEERAEMRAIAQAERLLSDDPKRALALTRAMAAGYPKSRFAEERAYLEVRALRNLGRNAELRDKAASFLSAYPSGLYSERVRKALAGQGE